ncbi:MAG: GNAT family N-acetyltransferase [Acidimicrobiia bacterium]
MRRHEPAKLVGARVYLRPLRAQDFAAWREVRLASREWLEPWEPRPEPGTADPVTDADAFRSRCSAWDRQRQFDNAYGFGLFLGVDDRFIGEVSLGTVHRGPFQAASIGYWVDRRQAGNGYVPEGVALIVEYAFETLGLHRLEAAIVPRNAASRRVATKLGLREEGIAARYLQINGVYEDHVRYAITAEEWQTRRPELIAIAHGARIASQS